MKIETLKLPGTFKIILEPHTDERGYFLRTFDEEIFQAYGLSTQWVQENQSFSVRNVVRGLHFQKPPHAETKLVRVVVGKILDVLVDLRRGSPTYGQWDSIELAGDDPGCVYVPRGFAHGYCTLSGEAVVLYKVDAYYAPASEGGIRWNDGTLSIPWPIQTPLVSPKDANWPDFLEFETPFE